MLNVIGLYGDTCSGKSTLGQGLTECLEGCHYLSYGDLKRGLFESGNQVALEIADYVGKGRPIPVQLSAQILCGHLKSGLNILSGFPISEDEISALSSLNARLIGAVQIDISFDVQFQRFFDRAECPICRLSGKKSDYCIHHNVPMVIRSDSSPAELQVRNDLYNQRIERFLRSAEMLGLPRIVCDGDRNATTLLSETSEWLKTTFTGILMKGE
jgi:adenylate kinase family enzyme